MHSPELLEPSRVELQQLKVAILLFGGGMAISQMTFLTTLYKIYRRYQIQLSPSLISRAVALIHAQSWAPRAIQGGVATAQSRDTVIWRGDDHFNNDVPCHSVQNPSLISTSPESQLDHESCSFNPCTLLRS